MTGLKSGIFHTPFRTPFASRLIHICVDLQEIRTSDAHPQIPQEPCGRKDTEAFAHLRGQPQNPQEGRAACTKPENIQKPPAVGRGLLLWAGACRTADYKGAPQNRRFCGERRSKEAGGGFPALGRRGNKADFSMTIPRAGCIRSQYGWGYTKARNIHQGALQIFVLQRALFCLLTARQALFTGASPSHSCPATLPGAPPAGPG